MKTLGERIRYVREEVLKISQGAFATRLGFTRIATISDYEKDKRAPDIETLRKIADIGAVTLEWLLTGKGVISIYETARPAEIKEAGGMVYAEEFVEVKVYDMSDAKGPENFPGAEPIDSIFVPKNDFKKGPVAIRIKGNSMSPNILDGATVGIDTKDRRLVSGNLYAVWLSYEGVTVKRVFVHPDRIDLKPDNPTFPVTTIPSDTTGEDFIIGKVAWVFQRY